MHKIYRFSKELKPANGRFLNIYGTCRLPEAPFRIEAPDCISPNILL
jgi:hypothetical protein